MDKQVAEVKYRGIWTNQLDFFLSCLGYAVGISTVWRFPYICYSNGGGAFLIPYSIMLLLVGTPLFFVELLIGQYSGRSASVLWDMAPLFKGLGLGMIYIIVMFATFYPVILAWAGYYMVLSFSTDLPWDSCLHDFNTDYCYSRHEAYSCENDVNGTWFNQTCYARMTAEFCEYNLTSSWHNGTCYSETTCDTFGNFTWKNLVCGSENLGLLTSNITGCTECLESSEHLVDPVWLRNQTNKFKVSTEEFFYQGVLGISTGIGDIQGVRWPIVISLAVCWIVSFICLAKGVKTVGKAVYFTAVFPYVILVILFFRGITLPGAGTGIKYFITPVWSRLLDTQVWIAAAGQVFFSVGVGAGALTTFASFNRFEHNIYRDAVLISLANGITSVFAGFVIFSILGHMAHILDTTVDNVVSEGPGLAFVAYPELVSYLPPRQLWSVLFFFMLVLLGIDNVFAGIETVISGVSDLYPVLRHHKILTAAVTSMGFFLVEIIVCTNAGLYWLELLSHYATGWSLILMTLIESIVFSWIYGATNMMKHVEEMTGIKLWWHWWVMWVVITPAILMVILVFSLINFNMLDMPGWATGLGWILALNSLMFVIVFAIIAVVNTYRHENPGFEHLGLAKRIVKLCQPNENWGPSYTKNWTMWEDRLNYQEESELRNTQQNLEVGERLLYDNTEV